MTSQTRDDNRPFFLPKRSGKGRASFPETREPPAAATARPDLPPLVLLTDDAAGHSVRRMTPFADARAACKHIAFWFPQAYRGRLTAFWALSAEPRQTNGEPVEVEALVLVRVG